MKTKEIDVEVNIKVDSSELDETIEKVKELNEALDQLSLLLHESYESQEIQSTTPGESDCKTKVCNILVDYLKKITDTDRNRTDSEIQSVPEVAQVLALFLF